MARQILSNGNYNQTEIQNVVLQNLGTPPGTPKAGQVYFNTTSFGALIWNGTAWVPTDATQATGIPNTALATNPLARANHTGTQLAATISNFAAAVQAFSLSSFGAPTAAIAMAGFTLTGLPAPSAAGQAAEYSWVIGQVQAAAAGISSKDPVVALAAGNISLAGLQTIDGVSVTVGQRVAVIGQTTATQNGIYNAASGAWTRVTTEGGTQGELDNGAMWLVLGGTVYGGTQFRLSTQNVTVGTTSVSIVQFGAAASYSNGNGITLTGSVFSFNPATGGGLAVNAAGASVDTTVARVFVGTIGDGTSTSLTVPHNLGKQFPMMQCKRATTPFDVVECEMQGTSTTAATYVFAVAPTAGQYVATCVG